MKHFTRMAFAGLLATMALPVLAQETKDVQIDITFQGLLGGTAREFAFDGTSSGQLFVFNGNEGDQATVSVTQAEDSLLDPYIALYGPAGEFIAYDDDSGDEPLAARIEEAELPVNGTYFLLVTDASQVLPVSQDDAENLEGEFTVLVEGVTSNSRAVDLTIFPLEVGTPELVPVREGRTALYGIFSAAEGDEVTVYAQEDEDPIDLALMVFDPTGARIAAVDDTEEGTAPAIAVEANADGDYLVLVGEYNFPRGEANTEAQFLLGVE